MTIFKTGLYYRSRPLMMMIIMGFESCTPICVLFSFLFENIKLSSSNPNIFLYVQTTHVMATSSPTTSPSSRQPYNFFLTSHAAKERPPPSPSFVCCH